MHLVISQPMFLPWVGLVDQIRLADVFVHYDDVQMPRGRSFISRVQVKLADGIRWLTAPLDRKNSGTNINEIQLLGDEKWRRKHIATLRHAFANAPHLEDMMELVEEIYGSKEKNLAKFNEMSLERIASYFGISAEFHRSSDLGIGGKSTQRLIEICKYFGASEYITGHGARNYLDHEAFEHEGIRVSYMRYNYNSWPQLHGPFTPYVTTLDLIANCGKKGIQYISSGTVDWKEFVNGSR